MKKTFIFSFKHLKILLFQWYVGEDGAGVGERVEADNLHTTGLVAWQSEAHTDFPLSSFACWVRHEADRELAIVPVGSTGGTSHKVAHWSEWNQLI